MKLFNIKNLKLKLLYIKDFFYTFAVPYKVSI